MLISDIGAQVVTSLLNVGPRVAVGDLCYEDFQAEARHAEASFSVTLAMCKPLV